MYTLVEPMAPKTAEGPAKKDINSKGSRKRAILFDIISLTLSPPETPGIIIFSKVWSGGLKLERGRKVYLGLLS